MHSDIFPCVYSSYGWQLILLTFWEDWSSDSRWPRLDMPLLFGSKLCFSRILDSLWSALWRCSRFRLYTYAEWTDLDEIRSTLSALSRAGPGRFWLDPRSSEIWRAKWNFVFTVRAMLSAVGSRNSVRLSVRPSVCPSVTRVLCDHGLSFSRAKVTSTVCQTM